MDLMVTAYDLMHSMGIDLHPYTRLFAVLRDRILGVEVADDPPAATFADGVAGMRCSTPSAAPTPRAAGSRSASTDRWPTAADAWYDACIYFSGG